MSGKGRDKEESRVSAEQNVAGALAEWAAPDAAKIAEEAEARRIAGQRAHCQELADHLAALTPRILSGRGDKMRPPRFYPILSREDLDMILLALRQMSEGY